MLYNNNTMSNENNKFAEAVKEIEDAYNIEILDAKKNKTVALVDAMTRTITNMIEKESDKIISEIKDDETKTESIERITCDGIFNRLIGVIKNPNIEPEIRDIEMDEAFVEYKPESD